MNLTSKKHFEILDGLRGIAAITVVIFHFMECIITDYSKNFIAHGYLAVDFFFCLSGFVIAYAYQNRLSQMSFKRFAMARLIRLQPMLVLGGILGVIAFYIDPNTNYQWNYSVFNVGLMLIGTWLVIPHPVMEERYFNNFGFNAPEWSLFWEYVANIVFAIWIFRIKNIGLYILAFISAVLLIYIAFDTKNLMGGWGKETFWHGFARVSWSFIIGIFIYRFQWKIKNSLGFWGLGLLLLLCFIFPFYNDSRLNGFLELITVIIIFPLIIVLGVGTKIKSGEEKICKLSGDISYPLYMLHYCMLWIFSSYYNKFHPDNITTSYIVTVCTIGSTVASYYVFKYIDKPLRKYLLERFIGKNIV